MTATDDLLKDNQAYASSFAKAESFTDLEADVTQSVNRIRSSPFIAKKDNIRGFV